MRTALLLLGLLLPLAAVAGGLPLDLPGAPPLSASQREQRGASARRLVQPGQPTPTYVNRLVDAASPYLERHALQPVDWYPWGDEALARARAENKPIFLSIGYSTCHWCHVMADESFADPQIAAQINRDFIAIKVDREERPDLDAVYIAAVQRLTGQAGWPLTVFLTPERKPFFGGTYFPPHDRDGRVGMPRLLTRMAEVWRDERTNAVAAADDLVRQLAQTSSPTPAALDRTAWNQAAAQVLRRFDRRHGGLSGAPKFPPTQSLLLLLRQAAFPKNEEALSLVELTLDRMAAGALRDHLGGGFHRYAVDVEWRRPHFEKMLSDQALLARAYLEAFHRTRQARHAAVAREVLAYTQRALGAPDGTFYAAEDADSGGKEGGYYLWSYADLVAAVGAHRAAFAAEAFGIVDGDEPAALRQARSVEELAQGHALSLAATEEQLAAVRTDLARSRDRRPHPRRDDKILPAWNGLMIASLAYGARVLDDASLARAAAAAATALLERSAGGATLARAYRRPPASQIEIASGPAFLEDYAFFALGLVELYEATFDARWLEDALRVTQTMLRQFGNGTSVSYTGRLHEALVAPIDDQTDGAIPAARAIAAQVLARLGRLTQNRRFSELAQAELTAASGGLRRNPVGYASFANLADFLLGPTQEIVIAGTSDETATTRLVAAARTPYLPRAVYLRAAPSDGTIERLAPFVARQTALGQRPTAYVCENYVCSLPLTDPAALLQRLQPRR